MADSADLNESSHNSLPEILPPMTKREAGSLVSLTGHDLLKIVSVHSKHDKRIAKLKKRIKKIEEERDAEIGGIFPQTKHIASLIAEFVLEHWEVLRAKGQKSVYFGTGEVNQRLVGKPEIRPRDGNVQAALDEIRRRKRARDFIRHPEPELNLSALHDDLEFAKSLKTLEVIQDTKLEIHATVAREPYLMISLDGDGKLHGSWKIGPEKKFSRWV